MIAAYAPVFRLSLPLLAGCAVMRLIVAPLALAESQGALWMQLCLAKAAPLSEKSPMSPEDMTSACPHMLRPRKAAASV